MQLLGIVKGTRFQFAMMILMVMILGLGNAAFAQETQIKKVPVKQSPANSGEQMFKQYCAACHGKTGTGDGPAALALKEAPANLATLAERHGGKFPDEYVASVLRNGAKAPAHGDAEMPVWGPLFSSLDQNDAIVNLRIANLTRYIKTLQVK